MKSIYYDVDIASSGSRQDYEDGNEIPWQKQMTYDTREEADQAVKHFLGKVACIRIVRVTDPENDPEIKDVFKWFKFTLNEKAVHASHKKTLDNFFGNLSN